MRKSTVSCIFMMFVLTGFWMYIVHIETKEPEIGSKWKLGDDPFRGGFTWTVVDVKDGYVLIRCAPLRESMSVRVFNNLYREVEK